MTVAAIGRGTTLTTKIGTGTVLTLAFQDRRFTCRREGSGEFSLIRLPVDVLGRTSEDELGRPTNQLD